MSRPEFRFSPTQSLNAYAASSHQADRRAVAAESRRARRLQRDRAYDIKLAASRTPDSEHVVLRPAELGDGAAIARLASLDDAARPKGEVLLAELDGRVVAALPLDGGPPIADPFRLTSDLVDLLRRRAGQIAARDKRETGWRRPFLRLGRA
jgi:hypothetical protein